MAKRHDPDNVCEACGSSVACDCLERILCIKAGQPGHFCCGWCPKHNGPRFKCLCTFKLGE